MKHIRPRLQCMRPGRSRAGIKMSTCFPFSYPEPFLRAARRGALAKSITGYHKNMVRKQCPVLELANQMPVRNMDLARAPRRTARKKGSGYENACFHETGTKITKFSIYSPCQEIFFFRWILLACVVPMSRLQPRPI